VNEAPGQPSPGLFESLFGRAPHSATEENKLNQLLELLHATARASDEDYLELLAIKLPEFLGADMCAISALLDRETELAEAMAFSVDGKLQGNFEYPLSGRPCGKTALGEEYFCGAGLQEQFPSDSFLKDEKVQAYFGLPFFCGDSKQTGSFCVLFRQPIQDASFLRRVMELFVGRVGSEVGKLLAARQRDDSDAMLRNLAQEVPAWMCCYWRHPSGERRILFSNDGMDDILGYDAAQRVRENPMAFDPLIHPDDFERVKLSYDKAAVECGRYDLEYRVLREDGSPIRVRTSGVFVDGPDDGVIGYAVMVETEEVRQLKQRNELAANEWQSLVTALPHSVLSLDSKGRVLSLNQAGEVLLDLTADDVIGQTFLELAEQLPDYRQVFERAHANCETAWTHGAQLDTQHAGMLPGDGENRYFEVSRVPMWDSQGQRSGMVILSRDITQRVLESRRQNELRELRAETERMQSMARLIDGMCHEFENLMTSIIGNCQIARRQFENSSKPQRELPVLFERVKTAATEAGELAKDLLSFSRPHEGVLGQCEPAEELERRHSSLRTAVGSGISLALDLAATPHLEIGLHGQTLSEIVMHLLSNAREAMQGTGRVWLSGRQVTGQSKDGADAAPHYELVVRDDGPGIPKADLGRIFDPLYSGRGHERRRGLGLAIVHGRVRRAGGSVDIDSQLEHGTRVRVTLPLLPKPEATVQEAGLNSCRILVVENDLAAGELISEVLEAGGYEVVLVRTPAEAEEFFAAAPASVQLVLCDVLLDGMSGPQLIKKLEAQHSKLRVLYCSGLPAHNLNLAGIHIDEHAPLLQKPFRPTELLMRVSEQLSFSNTTRPSAPSVQP